MVARQLVCHGYLVASPLGCSMALSRIGIPQGSLDLMLLLTLVIVGTCHGYGLAQHLADLTNQGIRLNTGTLYASLSRMVRKGWITSARGVSSNNRKAIFYSLTHNGMTALERQIAIWKCHTSLLASLVTHASSAISETITASSASGVHSAHISVAKQVRS